MTTVDVLYRALALALDGQKNPGIALTDVAASICGPDHVANSLRVEHDCPDAEAHRGAWLASQDAAGGTLTGWYGDDGVGRTVDDTVELFRAALIAHGENP